LKIKQQYQSLLKAVLADESEGNGENFENSNRGLGRNSQENLV